MRLVEKTNEVDQETACEAEGNDEWQRARSGSRRSHRHRQHIFTLINTDTNDANVNKSLFYTPQCTIKQREGAVSPVQTQRNSQRIYESHRVSINFTEQIQGIIIVCVRFQYDERGARGAS